MAQLELHDLTVFYPGQETPALRGVTASLEAGEFVTLCCLLYTSDAADE